MVRIDERGNGSSPGYLDTMSASTSSDFAECVEWAAEQEWSTGKVGLLGISYYGGTQWRVAARKPKGLACIIPWEGKPALLPSLSVRASFAARKAHAHPLCYSLAGMTDYYRDRVRQGGILANKFVHFVRSLFAFRLCVAWRVADALKPPHQWWNNQVVTMQYGNGEKAVRRWGASAFNPPFPPPLPLLVPQHGRSPALRTTSPRRRLALLLEVH